MKLVRNYQFTVEYCNDPQNLHNSNREFIAEFDTFAKAEKAVREAFENNPDMSGMYIIATYNPSTDVFGYDIAKYLISNNTIVSSF